MVSKNQKRSKYYLWGTLFTVTIILIIVSVTDFRQSPDIVCGSCHSMKPQLLTWQVSSHSQTGCNDCHADRGIEGNVQVVKNLGRYLYREAMGDYRQPIQMYTGVEDERCLSCHSPGRHVSSAADIIMPHDLHTDRDVRCYTCHANVAHGGIAERDEYMNVIQWDTDMAVSAMSFENTTKPMSECMHCHKLRRVTNDCSTCHSALELPEYHLLADFTLRHGDAANDFVLDCHTCHGLSGEATIRNDTSVRIYVRENSFCADCHRQRPDSHVVRWFGQHGKEANRSGMDSCLTCHDTGTTNTYGDEVLTQRTNCGTCHPSQHKPGFKSNHYPYLSASSRPTQSCYTCHSLNRCINCHITY